jgi:thioredoxin reductase (NADPH)
MTPVILSVDDEPSVGRAIARDLRRRYAERYRIVRASSGQEALEVIDELNVRGQPVALLLADHRMPGMTGVDFLEEAMDRVADAKRVLLTAYADTDAAIRAINDVDLDHYLLKPWDPPEERLYPVLDDLLDSWRTSGKPAFEGVRVVAHRWSAPSHEVTEFLAANGVPFQRLDADSPEAQRLLQAARTDVLPLVVTPSGTVLASPSVQDLAREIGLATTARRPHYDLVVVGGGPAGLGAAVYGASEGLRTLLVERAATGGQAGQSSRIENYLGFPSGLSGGDLAQRARTQATRFGAEILTANPVTALRSDGSSQTLALGDGAEVAASACVVATGVSYNRLPAAGADALAGRGIYYGAASHEAVNCTDAEVYVVGGANSAGQAAVHFSRYARRVTMLVRGDGLERTMSSYLIDQIRGIPTIQVRTCTEVAEAHGDDHLTALGLRDARTGETETVAANWLFVFIGAAPRTDWLDGSGVVRDGRGFVLAGPDLLGVDGRPPQGWPLDRAPYHLESSVPGVFVAGDVRAGSVKRVASAVGEGAMAVTLVHRYLEQS